MQALIQEHFIPAWQSIRQAPRVTLDLGGNKRIERTLRGNIASLILTDDGRVIDAWPGVYTPEAYIQLLTESLAIWNQALTAGKDRFEATVIYAHRSAHGTGGMVKLPRMTVPDDLPAPPLQWQFVTPRRRARLAPTKTLVERPLEVLLDREALTSQHTSEQAKKDWQGANIITSGDELEELSPLERDSLHHLSVKRPKVHAAFAKLDNLPTTSELEHLLFDELGGIPMNDPWLGFGALVATSPDGQDRTSQQEANVVAHEQDWFDNISEGLASGKKLRRPICLIRTIGTTQSFSSLESATVRETLSSRFVTVVETMRQSPIVHVTIDQDHQVSRPLRGNMVTIIMKSDGTVIDVIPGLGNDPKALTGALQLTSGEYSDATLEAYADRGDGIRWKILTRAEKTRLALSKMKVEMPLINAIGGQPLIPTGAPEALGDVYHLWPKARAIIAQLNNQGFGADIDKLTAKVFLEALGWDISDPMLGLEDTFAYDDARLASVARGAPPPGSP